MFWGNVSTCSPACCAASLRLERLSGQVADENWCSTEYPKHFPFGNAINFVSSLLSGRFSRNYRIRNATLSSELASRRGGKAGRCANATETTARPLQLISTPLSTSSQPPCFWHANHPVDAALVLAYRALQPTPTTPRHRSSLATTMPLLDPPCKENKTPVRSIRSHLVCIVASLTLIFRRFVASRGLGYDSFLIIVCFLIALGRPLAIPRVRDLHRRILGRAKHGSGGK